MDKRPYETLQLQALGTVQELTTQGDDFCTGSADFGTPFVRPSGDEDCVGTIEGVS